MRRSVGSAPGRHRRLRTAQSVGPKDVEEALLHHTTVVERLFGPYQTFDKDDDGTSAHSAHKSHRKTATEEWTVCEDKENETQTEDAEKAAKKGKHVIMKEGEKIDIHNVQFTLSAAMAGNYGTVEIVEETNGDLPFNLHYESSVNCKSARLKIECLIHVLAASTNRAHMHNVIQRGTDAHLNIHYFITDAYGSNVADLQSKRASKKFTVGTATRLAMETLDAIEDLHTIGFIHRDIRPTSYVIGQGPFETHIYLVNFASARKFCTKDGKIIPARSYVPFASCIKYASRACHDRLDSARRDDLESWLYMCVEFYSANILSWKALVNLAEIRRAKDIFLSEKGMKSLRIENPTLPTRLMAAVGEITSMHFESTPNYGVLKDVFKKHLETRNYKIKSKWDWATTAGFNENESQHK